MTFWKIDTSAYGDAYEQAIANLPAGGSMRDQISEPEFIATTSEYESSDARLLYLGQETKGNDTPVSHRPPWSVLADALLGYVCFDIARNGGPTYSPFWQGYKEACHTYDVPWGSIAWANLAIVQRADYDNASFSGLPEDDQAALAVWQKPVFQAMLRFVRPKRVLAVTGPNYDWLLDQMIDDIDWATVDGYDARTLRIGHSASFDLTVARTYHPNFLSRNGKWSTLKDALTALK